MNAKTSSYHGYRFPPEIISHAVWLYYRFCLSFRDVEDLLAYEIDPLLCPFCGADMRVLAFITDFATARAIRRSLKLPAQEPEPLAHGPPPELELLDQIA
jgi:hypothetical protein